MPLPRCLFDRAAPRDHDLSLVSGTWPDGLTGELVLSAPHPDTFDGPHPFFGEGMVYRLSLQPGTFGACWNCQTERPASQASSQDPHTP